jgi:hypothetical protein
LCVAICRQGNQTPERNDPAAKGLRKESWGHYQWRSRWHFGELIRECLKRRNSWISLFYFCPLPILGPKCPPSIKLRTGWGIGWYCVGCVQQVLSYFTFLSAITRHFKHVHFS